MMSTSASVFQVMKTADVKPVVVRSSLLLRNDYMLISIQSKIIKTFFSLHMISFGTINGLKHSHS